MDVLRVEIQFCSPNVIYKMELSCRKERVVIIEKEREQLRR